MVSKNYAEVTECRVCRGKDLVSYLNLGKIPLVNKLLAEEREIQHEEKYPLAVNFCSDCTFSQLSIVVDPEVLFRDYVYRSSVSHSFGEHCDELANELNKSMLNKEDLIVDIASNDGYLLRYFKNKGNKVLGIDPARNLAKIANESGIETLPEFWNKNLATKVLEKYGHAKVITAFNVFAHVPDMHSFVNGVKTLLSPEGYFIIEAPHLANLVRETEFDTIYHEHVSYLLVKPLERLMLEHGMRIAKARKMDIHGGSIRLYIEHQGKFDTSDGSTKKIIQEEAGEGLYHLNAYTGLGKRVDKIKSDLTSKLRELKSQEKVIAAFGASAKGNVLLNSCEIGKDLVNCIFDDTLEKQGKLSPGTHIPIISRDKMSEVNPDYLLLLAWNFADEMINKTKKFQEQGGKYIVAVPHLKII